jgi:hypothetical protein
MGLRAWWKRLWRRSTKPPARKEQTAPPPRSAAGMGSFVESLFRRLGSRYQPGEVGPAGVRLQCRYARELFRDTECYLENEPARVSVHYDVRVDGTHNEADALALVTELYGNELGGAGMTYRGAHRDAMQPSVVTLEFAAESSDIEQLARFIDFYTRGSESFLDMKHLQ